MESVERQESPRPVNSHLKNAARFTNGRNHRRAATCESSQMHKHFFRERTQRENQIHRMGSEQTSDAFGQAKTTPVSG